MALRDTLTQMIGRPAVRAMSGSISAIIEEILASRRFATPDEVAAVRESVAALRASAGDADRVKALEAEVASLKKRLGMAQGALQAATQQVADAKRGADEAIAVARQAVAQAQSALAAAESAADGAHELEARIEAQRATAKAGPAEAAPTVTADGCAVPGCDGAIRARGMCSRHYAQWKRGSLDGFVSPDGSLRFADGATFQLPTTYAGSPATLTPVGVTIGGQIVAT
jgi:hypothetical protein